LDPFFGNLSDPQSFQKYLYAHADPIGIVDPSGLVGLAGVSAGIGAANTISSIKTEADLIVYDAVKATVAGVQAGQSAGEIFASFVQGQIEGLFIGYALGKVLNFAGDIWEKGIVVSTPGKRTAGRRTARPVVFMHKGKFNIPRSTKYHGPKAAPPELPINQKRLRQFNATQRPRVGEWVDWQKRTDGVKDIRLDQAQLDVNGSKIASNRPDLQMTLEGGQKYTLPNGSVIDVPAGTERRIHIEFDPVQGGRSTPHARELIGNDPDCIVVLDVFDKQGLINSIAFNPL
jgi:hypothetical protein